MCYNELMVNKFQDLGRQKQILADLMLESAILNIYILFSGNEVLVAGDDQVIIMDLFNPLTPLAGTMTLRGRPCNLCITI